MVWNRGRNWGAGRLRWTRRACSGLCLREARGSCSNTRVEHPAENLFTFY